jgi:hypothetical protein
MIPGSANPLLLATAAAGGYSISRSVRFNSSDSAYLSRTPASAGNRKTWTWAGWVKRSVLGSSQTIFAAVQDGNNGTVLQFSAADKIQFFNYVGGAYAGRRLTTAVYRDPSSWYHIVLAWDSANGTTANRIRLYVNGVEVTVFDINGDPSSSDSIFNSTSAHYTGADVGFNNQYSNQCLADIYFINAQALDPTSFGEFDAGTGVWVPKAYTGSYGTNGFHLEFADNSSNTATTLGKDTSGLGNNWSPNNLSVTAGAGNDSLVDVPTNGSEVDTGSGGQVRGNYCTANPLAANGGATFSNGNLDVATPTDNNGIHICTIGITSGKWYWESTITNANPYAAFGITKEGYSIASGGAGILGASSTAYAYMENGQKYNNSSASAYGNTFTTNDVIGVAFDADAGSLFFYKNGVAQNSGTAAFTGLTSGPYFPAASDRNTSTSTTIVHNFGARSFAYTAPSGFKALNTASLPSPLVTKPSTVMDVLLWSGTGGNRSLTGLNMNPDFVWIKQRNQAYSVGHQLYDIVRGAGSLKQLDSSNTTAEGGGNTNQYGYLSSFDSAGFSVTAGSVDSDYVNKSGVTYAAWCWDAGSSTVTNTAGSISSQVRANASAGFSVVTWTQASAGANTIGHGLGVAPSLVIVKSRSLASEWAVYHAELGATKFLKLNATDAAGTVSAYWNNTAPTSSVFSVGSWSNLAGDNLAYCFAPVAGYSSFGSYVGNGSSSNDGPFVYTGFRPKWVMIKASSSDPSGGGWWNIIDATRNTYNAATSRLGANSSTAENNSYQWMDLLSNGFKLRELLDGSNVSGVTYIYAAFAESPFNYARAR